jgi:hypothetical protein
MGIARPISHVKFLRVYVYSAAPLHLFIVSSTDISCNQALDPSTITLTPCHARRNMKNAPCPLKSQFGSNAQNADNTRSHLGLLPISVRFRIGLTRVLPSAAFGIAFVVTWLFLLDWFLSLLLRLSASLKSLHLSGESI